MRTNVKMLAAVAASAVGLLGLAASPALASVAAPACESGASAVDCDAASVGTTTWTVAYTIAGQSFTSTYTTSVNYTRFGCQRGQFFRVSYSYVAGGVTQHSAISALPCNTGPPR